MSDTTGLVVMLVVLALAVGLGFAGVAIAFRSTATAQIRRRVRRISTGDVEERVVIVARPTATRQDEEDGAMMRFLRPLARIAKGNPDDANKLQERLSWAGIRNPHAAEIYSAIRVIGGLTLAGSAVIVDVIHPLSMMKLVAGSLGGFAVGFIVPEMVLNGMIGARQKELTNAMADTLDLLVAIVEAGVSLEQGLERVAREVTTTSKLLGNELLQAVGEIEAGIPRAEAFRRLAARTGLAEMRSLAGIFIQTEMFGTSVGKALRVLADTLRTQRMQRAQERAATISTKLTIPLIVCMLPAMMLVLMGGAVVQIAEILVPSLKGN